MIHTDFSPHLPDLIWFVITLGLLMFLSQWISQHIQAIGYQLTKSSYLAMFLYLMLALPGVLLHEVSHMVAAWLLFVPVRRFQIGIRPAKGRYVSLGSVEIADTDPIRATLIGLAPFLFGGAAILWIGSQVFGMDRMSEFSLAAFWHGLGGVLATPNQWLWLYLIFAIGNAMMPSRPDMRYWWVLVLVFVLGGAVFYFAGLLDDLTLAISDEVGSVLNYLTYAFALTILVDIAIVAVMFTLESLFELMGLGRDRH